MCNSTELPRLVTNVNKTYILYDEDTICLYASFDMEFLIIYTTGNETKVKKGQAVTKHTGV